MACQEQCTNTDESFDVDVSTHSTYFFYFHLLGSLFLCLHSGRQPASFNRVSGISLYCLQEPRLFLYGLADLVNVCVLFVGSCNPHQQFERVKIRPIDVQSYECRTGKD